MRWQKLLEPEIQNFIEEHKSDDVAALALKKPPQADWPWPLILDQIKSRQKAETKIPAWLRENIILPAPGVIEQCSSTPTANYKASLVQGKTFADLTGGVGVDCAALSKNFHTGFCIEHDEDSAALLKYNLPHLGANKVDVLHTDAESFVTSMPNVDVIYFDPQRRDHSRKGKYILKECTPDIIFLLPQLAEKAQRILLKTSPMLDIDETLQALKCVEAVHILEWRGECKEVLYILNPASPSPLEEVPITAVQLDDEGFPLNAFSFSREQETEAAVDYALPGQYLYEPGPAFQKAGGFSALGEHYGLQKLHKHTHLYTNDTLCPNFPGRSFKIFDMLPAGSKSLPVSKANLTLRNFPGTTDSLRKKMNLSDGGDVYIFACTLQDERKMLLLTHKI